MALPRLRLARVAGRILDGRQPDGCAHRRQPVAGRLVRAHDVPVAVQDARARAARLLEDGARYGGAADHTAHRAAHQTALTRGDCGSIGRCPTPYPLLHLTSSRSSRSPTESSTTRVSSTASVTSACAITRRPRTSCRRATWRLRLSRRATS